MSLLCTCIAEKKKLFSILYLRTQLYDIKKIHYRAWLNLIQGHQPHLLDEFFPLLVFFLIIRRFSRLCHSIMKAIYPSIFAVIDFVKKWLAKIAFSSLNRLAMRNNDAGVWSGTVRKWSPFHNHYKWQWLNPMIKIHPSTLAKSFDCFIRPISLICRCYTAFFSHYPVVLLVSLRWPPQSLTRIWEVVAIFRHLVSEFFTVNLKPRLWFINLGLVFLSRKVNWKFLWVCQRKKPWTTEYWAASKSYLITSGCKNRLTSQY